MGEGCLVADESREPDAFAEGAFNAMVLNTTRGCQEEPPLRAMAMAPALYSMEIQPIQ